MTVIPRASKEKRTDPATGIVFDSKGELGRWHELQLLVRAGEISELRRQVRFDLGTDDNPMLIRSNGFPNGRRCRITLDFAYREKGQDVIEDWKGFLRMADQLRIAIFEWQYGVRVRISGPAVRPRRRSQTEQ